MDKNFFITRVFVHLPDLLTEWADEKRIQVERRGAWVVSKKVYSIYLNMTNAKPLIWSPHDKLCTVRQMNFLLWFCEKYSLSVFSFDIIKHRLPKFHKWLTWKIIDFKLCHRIIVGAKILIVAVYLGVRPPPELRRSHVHDVAHPCDYSDFTLTNWPREKQHVLKEKTLFGGREGAGHHSLSSSWLTWPLSPLLRCLRWMTGNWAELTLHRGRDAPGLGTSHTSQMER